MVKKRLLSIVVPTKNRYEYLRELVSTLLSYVSQEFEIVIQDNSDDNSEFIKFLENYQDERLIYNYKSSEMSVVDNCNLGIAASTGEYVSMLGDDDGILPWSITIAAWMHEHRIESIITTKPHYVWPDMMSYKSRSNFTGSLSLPRFSFSMKEYQVSQELSKVLDKGGTDLGNLPRVYHAIIKKSILDALYQDTNSYFPGPSPDMSNSTGLTKYVDKVISIDFPVIITGNGYKSAGGQGARHEHHGEIENKTFLPKNTSRDWSPSVPKFWSGPTIWAESCIKALCATSQNDALARFNYAYLYASCFVFQFPYNKLVRKTINNSFKGLEKYKLIIHIIYLLIIIIFNRGRVFVENRITKYFSSFFTRKVKVISNVRSIRDATELIERDYADKFYLLNISIKPRNES